MLNKKSAFTLAEVLLVLAIIGVIAAVTIPAIMQQSSEKKFSALAKKAHSTLQNAIDLKIATVPIGPGDMGVGLLQWLLDGEEDGTNTLKAVQRNNLNNTTVAQLPDGMIYNLDYSTTCSSPSTKTNFLGCTYRIAIDLNGSDGPTKTTINDATSKLGTGVWSDKKAYDVIILIINIQNDGKVKPLNNSSSIASARTIKYLGIDRY